MRKAKPYTSNSLPAAIREVRMLRKLHAGTVALLERYAVDRKLLAQLAADTPQFDNPLHVWEVKELRDKILKEGRLITTMPAEEQQS